MAKGGSKGGGQPPQERDLSSDASFFWRFVKMIVAGAARRLGNKGFDVQAVNIALTTIETLIGPELTRLGVDALGAAVQNPQVLKQLIARMGWPIEVSQLIDEFIDDVFEGLGDAMRERGKVNGADVNKALATADSKLEKKMVQKRYEDIFVLLPVDRQRRLLANIHALGPDDKKRFDALRPKITDYKVLAVIIDMTSVEMFEYLEHIYGAVKPKAEGKSLVQRSLAFVEGLAPGPAFHAGLDRLTRDLEEKNLDDQWHEVMRYYSTPVHTRQACQRAAAIEEVRNHRHITLIEAYEGLVDGRLSLV